MLARRYAHPTLAQPARQLGAQLRGKATAASKPKVAKPKAKHKAKPQASDVARRLDKTGVWRRTGGRKKVTAAEPWRVNVVSEGLCGKASHPVSVSPTLANSPADLVFKPQTTSSAMSARRSSGTAGATSSTSTPERASGAASCTTCCGRAGTS